MERRGWRTAQRSMSSAIGRQGDLIGLCSRPEEGRMFESSRKYNFSPKIPKTPVITPLPPAGGCSFGSGKVRGAAMGAVLRFASGMDFHMQGVFPILGRRGPGCGGTAGVAGVPFSGQQVPKNAPFRIRNGGCAGAHCRMVCHGSGGMGQSPAGAGQGGLCPFRIQAGRAAASASADGLEAGSDWPAKLAHSTLM